MGIGEQAANPFAKKGTVAKKKAVAKPKAKKKTPIKTVAKKKKR